MHTFIPKISTIPMGQAIYDILAQHNRRRSESAQAKIGAGQNWRRPKSAQAKIGAGQIRRRPKSAQKKNEPTWLYSALIKKIRVRSL